jgi:(p)ppGpp synthase/HD superfamily hydrolase
MRDNVSGYSDRVNHAFAFAAKHHAPRAPAHAPLPFIAQPANVAVILARHGADEITLTAGILHLVLEAAVGYERPSLEEKIGDKFGSIVLGLAREAAAEMTDLHGQPVPWRHRKRAMLIQVLDIHPRALDIRSADEIHECGSAIALATRLGPEYLDTQGFATRHEILSWYADLADALKRRPDWPTVTMRNEVTRLASQFAAAVRPT